MAAVAHAYRGRIERRASDLIQTKTKTNLTPKKNNTTSARRIHVCSTCGQSTMASEPTRTRLLCAIISVFLPVAFGHTTACRSPDLTFSTATTLPNQDVFLIKACGPTVCLSNIVAIQAGLNTEEHAPRK